MRRRSRIAAIFAAPLLLVATNSLAGPPAPAPGSGTEAEQPPATESNPAPPPTGDDLPSDRPTLSDAPSLKAKLEAGMAELGQIVEDAKRDGDAVRAACAVDKRDRGRSVMEVATGELLVIQDTGSSRQQKAFAVEKLQAAADRMRRLVQEAEGCSGDNSPEDEDNVTRNDVDEPPSVPVEDPTLADGDPKVLPPVGSADPVAIGSPSR